MGKPTVFRRAVPMFNPFRNIDDITRFQFLRRLSPFLIPAAAGNDKQGLSGFVMNMPVIAGSRLKSRPLALPFGTVTTCHGQPPAERAAQNIEHIWRHYRENI